MAKKVRWKAAHFFSPFDHSSPCEEGLIWSGSGRAQGCKQAGWTTTHMALSTVCTPFSTDTYFHDFAFGFAISMTNIKVTNMKNTAGKSARSREESGKSSVIWSSNQNEGVAASDK